MSHWTKTKAKIKDLGTLERTAKELGCTVQKGVSLNSQWAGAVDAEMVLSYTDKSGTVGVAGVVKDKNGEYVMQMDEYYNPIVEVIGVGAENLMHGYTANVVRGQASQIGFVSGEVKLENGDLEIHITI